MGETFFRPIFGVGFECACYSRDRGWFSEILGNLISFSCENPKRRNIIVLTNETAENVSFMYTFEKISHFCLVV